MGLTHLGTNAHNFSLTSSSDHTTIYPLGHRYSSWNQLWLWVWQQLVWPFSLNTFTKVPFLLYTVHTNPGASLPSHFAWNRYTTVYSSHLKIVLGLVTYCRVFVETCWAHTLLGTVILLFIPASVHRQTYGWLTLDRPACGLRVPLFWPIRAR